MIAIVGFLEQHGVLVPPILITDVGAMAVGGDPWDPLVERGTASVLGFEPQTEERRRLEAQGRANRRILPDAIGDGVEWPFHRCNYPMTSSMYPPNADFVTRFQNLGELMRVVDVTRVATRRLDDVAAARATDLLKLDTQGFELVILEHAPATLAHATLVQTEVSFVPLYRDQPLFADVDALMRRHGFMLHTMLDVGSRAFRPLVVNNNPSAGLRQWLWTDAVYVRDVAALPELAPDGLLKLAVLLHAVYGSYDLAAVALRHHDQATGSTLEQPYLEALVGGTRASGRPAA